MKYLLFLFPLVFLLMGLSACQPAKESSNESDDTSKDAVTGQPLPSLSENGLAEDRERAEQALHHLLESVRTGENHLAADLIVYRGKDRARRWSEACNYENVEEQVIVDGFCQRMRSLEEGTTRWEVLNFFKEKESEGEWNVLETEFYKEEGSKKTVSFAFLRIRNQFLLGDIED